MQKLARRVEHRDTTWDEVFEGTSPFVELLRGHLDAMGERYAATVRRAIEDDSDFDRTETSPGV